REVVRRAAAHDFRVVRVTVLVHDLDRPVVVHRVGHDVVVGDVVTRAVEHEAGARGAVLLPLVLRQDLDRAGQQPLGDGGDRVVPRRKGGPGLGAGAREPAADLTLGRARVPVLVGGSSGHAT